MDLDGHTTDNNLASPSSPRNEPAQAGGSTVGTNRSSSTTPTPAGLEPTCQEPIQTVTNPGSRRTTYPIIKRTSPGQVDPAKPTPQQIWSSPNPHPLDTLRKRGFGSEYGSRSGGPTAGGSSTADEIAKLRLSLKKAQEETDRERERREVCEKQARAAYASMEAESKR